MATGRLTFMTEPGRIELREYELPRLAPGQLLIEIQAAGICGSEVHMFCGRHPLRSLALGHEFVGRVVDASPRPQDSAGEPIADGDLVTATYTESCLRCPACSRGEFNLCVNGYTKMISNSAEPPHFVGGLATHYVISPLQWVYKVPAALSATVAASANCAVAQVACAIERGAPAPGERVVIQGAGGLGLYATAMAKERGARVVVIDGVESRLRTAARFGADEVISIERLASVEQRREAVHELTGGGADLAFDFAGTPAAVAEGVALVRPGGRYLEIGSVLPGVSVDLDLGHLTRSGIPVIPVIRYLPRHLRQALGFLERNLGRLPLEELVDGRYPLEEVEAALEDAVERRVNRAAIVAAGI